MWALDTDTLTLWLHGHARVVWQVDAHDPQEIGTTIITVEEVLSGWYRIIRQARDDDRLVRAYRSLQEAAEFLGQVAILPFDEAAARRFRELRKMHRQIGTNDLRIASISLGRGATVVSRNLIDFRHIDGLDVVDWSV